MTKKMVTKKYPGRKTLDVTGGIIEVYDGMKYTYKCGSAKQLMEAVLIQLAKHKDREDIMQRILAE